MLLFWNYFVLSFGALLPLINPVGSALIFVGLVGQAPIPVYHSLSRRIALNTVLFLTIIDLVGSAILRFFGISLPIVQVSGGLVIAAIGWSMLNQQGSQPSTEKMQGAAQMQPGELAGTLRQKVFYPFTFPITAGPGCIVVMLTLAAHTPQRPIQDNLLAHAGLLLAILVLCLSVYFCYAHAHRIADRISPSTAHGILRVMAFILLCIGVQIAWNGLAPLLSSLIHPA
ncbi:MAG TPA: MarC family protein [Acidobacteriaceae bacterium]|nr:MarC family protein [Acidobacteriaceae bacterium]